MKDIAVATVSALDDESPAAGGTVLPTAIEAPRQLVRVEKRSITPWIAAFR